MDLRFDAAGEAPVTDIHLRVEWVKAGCATELHHVLLSDIDWICHQIRMFGRQVDVPRLSSWIGDPGAAYRYSGVRHEPRPWSDALVPVRDRLVRETGVAFNSVLANLYRDGRDCMGWHSDDEPELGERPVIASLSLGATRRFVLKHRRDPGRKIELALPHGSLLLMRGDTQRDWRHALPRTAKPVGARINLTFRSILPLPGTGPAGERRDA